MLVYKASSIARGYLFRFTCCRKYQKNAIHGHVYLIFLWWLESLIPHTGDHRFHATPSDVETRKKKKEKRRFNLTKI